MATFTLTSSGTHALTPGTVALHVTITTLPTSAGSGFAYPTDQYGVGFFRFGDGTAFWEPYPVMGGPQWMAVPNGATQLGYALLSLSAVSVTEVAAPAPLAFPLSTLPDVAVSGPADTQVLTYQASSSKWINAAAPAGGGGGTGTAPTLTTKRVTHHGNWTISVTSFTAIDTTNLALVVTMAASKSVLLSVTAQAYNNSTNGIAFDWFVVQPTLGTARLNSASTWGMTVLGGGNRIALGVQTFFVAAEAGSHTFNLAAAVNTATATLCNATSGLDDTAVVLSAMYFG